MTEGPEPPSDAMERKGRQPARRPAPGALRLAGIAVGAVVVLALAVLGGGYLWLRTSLPEVEGTRHVPGLEARVEILRDRYGIPHIYAASEADAYFALGFVHAQDRLWQMEFQRRIGAGRLSEVFGKRTLDTDRFLRTLGVYRAAEASLAALDDGTRALIEAYARGVNAYLATRHGALPPEFVLLGLEPEPWRPADSLVWLKMMAWDLGANWRDELLRAELSRRLGRQRTAELWPPYPEDAPEPLFRLAHEAAGAHPPAAHVGVSAVGSNAFAVGPSRTAGAGALLANDPHLGLRMPSVWYLAHLEAPGLSFIGATLPGVPAPVLGRNARIAWGFTNTNPDVEDLFVERLDPEDPSRYLVPGGSAPFHTRREVIRVKGAGETVLEVRETRHGPVISDVVPRAARLAGRGRVMALAWTGLATDDTTAGVGFRLARARSWTEFVSALEGVVAPQQNVIYADVEGRIGFIAPGRVPIRASGRGRVPAPGWSGTHDWIGWIPFEILPRVLAPASDSLVSANERIVDDAYPYFIGDDWSPPYRARRIHALIEETRVHDVASFRAIQLDVLSLAAEDVLPLMLAEADAYAGDAIRPALALLGRWDAEMRADRPEPLIFAAWLRAFERALYGDELGDDLGAYWDVRPLFVRQALTRAPHWCDDVRTPEREPCGKVLAAALGRALADLAARYGPDPAHWRWGRAHQATSRHKVLGKLPRIGALFDIRLPAPGGAQTVNAGQYRVTDAREPFAEVHGPSLRAIYDLARPERSRFVHTTGQSGNPFSPHYRDLAPLWAAGRYVPMITARKTIEAAAPKRLVLEPVRETTR